MKKEKVPQVLKKFIYSQKKRSIFSGGERDKMQIFMGPFCQISLKIMCRVGIGKQKSINHHSKCSTEAKCLEILNWLLIMCTSDNVNPFIISLKEAPKIKPKRKHPHHVELLNSHFLLSLRKML